MNKRNIEVLLARLATGDKNGVVTILRQAAASEQRSGRMSYAVTLEGYASKIERASSYEPKLMTLLNPSDKTRASLAAFEERVPIRRFDDVILDTDNSRKVRRLLKEHTAHEKLLEHNLAPRSRVLLAGPPGSGKTMLAEILASETGKSFHILKMGSLVESYLGNTIRNIENSFAAIAASDGVFLFDEFDALSTARDDKQDVNEMRRALNSLLQCFENHRGSSIVVAATNHPSSIDHAFRRRFDAIWLLGNPTEAGRRQIVKATFGKHQLPQSDWIINDLTKRLEGASYDECEDSTRALIITAVLDSRTEVNPDELDTAARNTIMPNPSEGTQP